nr:putative KTx Tcis10 [Tityus cisandinus]
MKDFYGMLMIFVLCSMCYISVHSQLDLEDVSCVHGDDCVEPCKKALNSTKGKCINDICTCYP